MSCSACVANEACKAQYEEIGHVGYGLRKFDLINIDETLVHFMTMAEDMKLPLQGSSLYQVSEWEVSLPD